MEEYINLKKEMAERTSSTTIAGLTDQMLRLEPQLQKCDDEMQSFLATNDAALLQEASGVGSYLGVLYQQMATAQSQYALLQSMTLDQNLLLEQDRAPALIGAPTAERKPAHPHPAACWSTPAWPSSPACLPPTPSAWSI